MHVWLVQARNSIKRVFGCVVRVLPLLCSESESISSFFALGGTRRLENVLLATGKSLGGAHRNFAFVEALSVSQRLGGESGFVAFMASCPPPELLDAGIDVDLGGEPKAAQIPAAAPDLALRSIRFDTAALLLHARHYHIFTCPRRAVLVRAAATDVASRVFFGLVRANVTSGVREEPSNTRPSHFPFLGRGHHVSGQTYSYDGQRLPLSLSHDPFPPDAYQGRRGKLTGPWMVLEICAPRCGDTCAYLVVVRVDGRCVGPVSPQLLIQVTRETRLVPSVLYVLTHRFKHTPPNSGAVAMISKRLDCEPSVFFLMGAKKIGLKNVQFWPFSPGDCTDGLLSSGGFRVCSAVKCTVARGSVEAVVPLRKVRIAASSKISAHLQPILLEYEEDGDEEEEEGVDMLY
ncbi:hypothetical protein C8R46DRAFT_1029361 [Mycena filopes]|nr:hypothetical protein C8R46DRAFT_1029361 [Mycena filopes]